MAAPATPPPPPPIAVVAGTGGRQEERRADGDGTPWSAGGPKTPQGCWPRTAGTPRRKPPTRTAGSLARTGSCPPGTSPGGEADAVECRAAALASVQNKLKINAHTCV